MNTHTNTLSVYRASAGSGKTFSLAVEYISLLMESPHPDEFKHILAVTFTNKATAEMKDRILGQLYGIAHGLNSSDDYAERILEKLEERGTNMDRVALKEKANRVLVAILHDFHHFRVETIDSFFQSILRSLAHELGLNANLQVELNDTELISAAVDQMFDELTPNDKGITRWILQYTQEKMAEGRSWDVSSDIKTFAKNIYKEEFRNRSREERLALSDPAQIMAFRKLMEAIIVKEDKDMRELVEAMLIDLDARTNNFADISNGIRWYRNFIASLPENLKTFRELSDSVQKVISGDYAIMLKSKQKEDPAMLSMARDVAQKIELLYTEYTNRFRRYHTALVAIKHINQMRLLGEIEVYAQAVAESNNQFLLNNTPALLSELVKGYDAPFVYEKAGIQFRHIMIDEFQDTSRMQWDNFKVLLFNNKSVGGRDLIVGDIKQSIYRWRGGDWRILHHFDDPKVGVPDADMKSLQRNFRSMGNVIEFNNRFFRSACEMLDGACGNMSKKFKLQDIYKDVAQEIASKKKVDKGYVRLFLHNDDTKLLPKVDYERQLAEDIRKQILRLHHPDGSKPSVPFNRMAIIVRRKEAGAHLIKLFRDIEREDPNQPQIPLVSDDAYLLSAALSVKIIIAALHVLSDPYKPDVLQLRYLVMHYHQDVLCDGLTFNDSLLQDAMHLLPQEFSDHLSELSILPLYVLIERLFNIFSLQELDGQGAYMMTFLDYVMQFSQTHAANIHTFVQYWEEVLCNKAIFAGEMNALRILTVHKSKGLEFDTVFIPDLDWDIEFDGGSRRNEILWMKAEAAEDGSSSEEKDKIEMYNTLGALPVSAQSSLMHSYYSPSYDLEHLDRRVDTLNILYVAFTRARSNLFVWGRYSTKSTFNATSTSPWADALTSGSLAADLLKFYIMLQDGSYKADHVQMEWEEGELYCEEEDASKEEENRMNAIKEDFEQSFHSYQPHYSFFPSNATKRYLASLSEDASTGTTQQSWEVGIIVHRILSRIRDISQIEAALEACQRDGLIANEELAAKVRQSLDAGFQLEAVKRWFSPDAEIFNECTITGRDAETGAPFVRRPDRVVLVGDEIYLVDFKLGHDQPTYHTQVREYMQLLKQMYPERRIYGSLWFILQRKVVDVSLDN